MEKQQSGDANNDSKGSQRADRLNLLIAVCAVLISAASFYATYLQADAAKKQVQVMTMPLLQFEHGNLSEDQRKVISFSINNAGLGPGHIRSIHYEYDQRKHTDLSGFLNACCTELLRQYNAFLQANPQLELNGFITTPTQNRLVPGQQKLTYFQLQHGAENDALWNRINRARFEMNVHLCYCSMLGDCYRTDSSQRIEPVADCR